MASETQDGWRIGVLFSQSGTTHVTERDHLRGTLLAVEEINEAGGVLGRPLVPVSYDPGAESAAFRALARRMLAEDEIDVIFGCSTSASRKAVLPIIERYNGLLFYPSMYEGFEYCENLLYTGATLNQTCLPLAEYLLAHHGRRIFFVGSDYIFPRESNRVMRDLIESKGGEVAGEVYLPLGATGPAVEELIDAIRIARPDAVFSTVIGTSAHAFYRLYDRAGIDRAAHPVASLTMAESEIAHIGPAHCDGHILAATYFQTLENDANRRFTAAYHGRYGSAERTSTWSEVAYMQVHLFARGLARVGQMDPGRIGRALMGEEFDMPEGRVRVDPETRPLWLTPRIGRVRADGLFDIVWGGGAPTRPDPYLATTRFEEASLREWA
ncbi:transporter substrate-binding domain-containing protein [Acidimangrovimonas sediminis]|uniref:transporter substrate-binding domain-containing protein n=1 Tax=Acidimangrovimonas sediminis TaxID=2056283 RepID=UPI000C804CF0|nr:transporter substrate-binding domain-containing protein [Acidimangrovimonas sediminis]